ncbi:MAG: c-type cytochrome domain-containing protein [Verrucomicrobiota bacterium]
MRSLLILTLLCLAPPIGRAIDFQSEIRPFLNKKCFQCHSGPRAKGKLRMDSDSSFSRRIGGDDPAIIPGNAAGSLILERTTLPRSDGEAMPPPPARARGAEALTSVELNLLRAWIDAGALLKPGAEPTPTTEPEPEAPAAEAMVDATVVQTWTNAEGNSLEAFFVGLAGTTVTLRKEDGTEFPYDISKLAPESQALARKMAGQ